MTCPFCYGEHETSACPFNHTYDFNKTVEPIFHEPYVAPMFNWLPVDYTEKLDRIIELLEALVENQSGEDHGTVPAWRPDADNFTCPWCGSHNFSTKGATGNWDEAIGLCHTKKCGFTWLRKDDEFHGFNMS